MDLSSESELTNSADSAVAAWEAVDASLSPIIGRRGVAALFRRSAQLSAADYPWLNQLQENLAKASGLAFQTMRDALARQDALEVATANRRLLLTFREQLVRLIGEDLTVRLLLPVWIATVPDEPLQDLREANERLLLSATDAQERESKADEAHRRHVQLQAVVVHELRNPLIPIRMAAELLKRAPNDGQMIAKLPGMIERQVSHMVRLIDDLLDSSRVNTGKFRLDYANVELHEVIATAVEIGKTAMDSRRQTLRVSVPTSVPAIYGDAARLTQVFSNLFDNASKYTPEGGDVALTVECSSGSVAITVSDNGIGIAAEMLPQVFDLFVQDSTGLIRHNGGLGIGLAVVRELVNAHGGSVAVESAGRNHGSKFVVTLPVRDVALRGEDT